MPSRETFFAILPNSYPVNYLGDDEGNFEAWREVFLLRNQPLLPSMVALVCNADSGVMLLYDVEASPFSGLQDRGDCIACTSNQK